jgi:monoterpene epsilon-lactone hydrolase
MREDMDIIFNHFKSLNRKISQAKNLMEIIEAARYKVENYASVNDKAPGVSREFSVKKVEINNIPCEWIYNEKADKDIRLLYIHGGGFIAGSLDSHRGLSAMFSELAGVSVLAVDYRLAPEHPFPAGLDDCYEAYNWLLENGPDGSQPAKSLFIAGDSAGGNLAIALALKLKKHKLSMPNALLAISPVLDLSAKSPSIFTMDGIDPVINKKALKGLPLIYLFGREIMAMKQSKSKIPSVLFKILMNLRRLIRHPYVSPLYADLSGLPPVLINVGAVELLRDEAVMFVEKAKKQGVDATVKVWPDMIHVFIAFWGHIPEAEECCREMASFIRQHAVQSAIR